MITYVDEGAPDRGTVCLIAGLGDDSSWWELLAGRLVGDGYRVIRPDHSGASTAEMAADVDEVLRAVAPDSALHVVGASLGGMIAQELGLILGTRLQSLVLVATCARMDTYARYLFAYLRELLQAENASVAIRLGALIAFGPGYVAKHPEEWGEADVALATELPPLEPFIAQIDAALGHDARGRLRPIHAQTLVLAGDRDALFGLDVAEDLAREAPSARLEVMPGGHCFVLDHPDTFGDRVVSFLKAGADDER